MKRDGILKNVKKFNNIKLAKGVNLHFFTTVERSLEAESIGISTETFGDKWFLTLKGRAIFKTFDTRYADNIRNIRIINELICKELCNQIGLDCAEYELAHIDHMDGLLTYDISKGKKLVSLSNFISINPDLNTNIFDCSFAVDKYIELGYKINKKDIITSMYKTILFDTLTLQTDRNSHNFNFLYDSKKKEFTTAKLIDNEFAFCGELLPAWIETNYAEDFKMKDIIDEYNLTGKVLTFDSEYFDSLCHLRSNIKNIVLYANKYPIFKKILNQTLNKLDLKSAFEKVEEQGIVINKHYKEYTQFLVDNVKKMILREKEKKLTKEQINDIEKIF